MSQLLPTGLPGGQIPRDENVFDVDKTTVSTAFPISGSAVNGSKTFGGVVTEPQLTFPGTLGLGPNTSFYNRILIEPTLIDVGNLLTPTTRSVQVWNGFFDSSSVQNFQHINDEGISVIEPSEAPYTLLALAQVDYTFVVGTDGPARINAEYIWTINGEDYEARIEGFRAFVFPFAPNFRQSFRETLEWRTNVLRSYSGKEQRRSVRQKARRAFDYEFWIGKDAQQLFKNSMLGWQNRIFALPVWNDKLLLPTALQAGDSVIPIDTTGYSFENGGSLIILKGEQEYEVLEIDTTGSEIVLIASVQRDWPPGTPFYPMIAAHLPVSVGTRQLTDTILEGSAQFTSDPSETYPYIPTSTPEVTYDGLEVITIQPNWEQGLDKEFSYQFDTVDMGVGKITWMTSESFARVIRKYSWLLKSRDEIAEFRAFLGRRQGRFKACWIPSWSYDFEIVGAASSTDTNIVTRDNGFFDFIGVNPAFDRLMIRMKVNESTNGQIFYRRITGLSRDPVTRLVTLALDAALGIPFAATDVLAIHYLFKCRLDTDRVLLEWRANNVAVVNTNFITVLE